MSQGGWFRSTACRSRLPSRCPRLRPPLCFAWRAGARTGREGTSDRQGRDQYAAMPRATLMRLPRVMYPIFGLEGRESLGTRSCLAAARLSRWLDRSGRSKRSCCRRRTGSGSPAAKAAVALDGALDRPVHAVVELVEPEQAADRRVVRWADSQHLRIHSALEPPYSLEPTSPMIIGLAGAIVFGDPVVGRAEELVEAHPAVGPVGLVPQL